MANRQNGFNFGVSLLLCTLGGALAANQIISWALPAVGAGLLAISLNSLRAQPALNKTKGQ